MAIPGVVGHVQPLVPVGGPGVGPRVTRDECASVRACRGPSPNAPSTCTQASVLVDRVRDRPEVVERASVDVARLRAHDRRNALVDRGGETLGLHPPLAVCVQRDLLLGIGAEQEIALDADREGRMQTEGLAAAIDEGVPTIVCAQAGDVNTGAFDDLRAIADAVDGSDAWVHVDGAFGLWAATSPTLAHLVEGNARADSWATDGHKWLNVPFDCGIAICAHPADHAAAMEYAAPYLDVSDRLVARDPMGYSPEFSRRARAVPVWAAIRELGREGVTDLVDRCCAHARAIADGVAALPGCEVLNDVVLNQVLFRFEDDARTQDILAAVQAEGEAWMSPTTRDGRFTIRISVVGWRTTEDDVERTVAAFARAAQERPG